MERRKYFFRTLHRRLAKIVIAFLVFIPPLARPLLALNIRLRKEIVNGSRDQLREAGKTDVVFIYGNVAPSFRYRCANMMEALSATGITSSAVDARLLEYFLKHDPSNRVYVLFREMITPALHKLRRHVEKTGSLLIFDVDDLMFLDSETEYLDEVNARITATRPEMDFPPASYVIRSHQQALALADACCAPTPVLCEEMARFTGKPAFLIQNTVNRAQMELAEEILAQRAGTTPDENPEAAVRISYWPGTQTHSFDFEACQAPLLDVMEAFPNLIFVTSELIVLEDPRWQPLSARVIQHPFMDYLTLLRVQSDADINIAPLDLGRRFNHAKSQLKVFEAGLVEIPTIASPTDAMLLVVDHGVDGFLAASHEEWQSALVTLVKDPQLRREVGRKARERALREFSIPAIVPLVRQLYEPEVRKSAEAMAATKVG